MRSERARPFRIRVPGGGCHVMGHSGSGEVNHLEKFAIKRSCCWKYGSSSILFDWINPQLADTCSHQLSTVADGTIERRYTVGVFRISALWLRSDFSPLETCSDHAAFLQNASASVFDTRGSTPGWYAVAPLGRVDASKGLCKRQVARPFTGSGGTSDAVDRRESTSRVGH